MSYLIGAALWILAVILISIHYRRRERRLLTRLQTMIDDSRAGRFVPDKQSETLLSSVENSMSQLLQRQSLSEDQLLGQKEKIERLISDISHQTVTPISNILLYSQLIEEKVLHTQLENSAAAIRQQAEKLGFLVDSLVKASRLETGIMEMRPSPSPVNEIIKTALDQVKEKAREKKLSILWEEADCEIAAFCDPKWTAEALFNIVDNAVKYTAAPGTIQINTKAYPFFCRIDISDTGFGMEEQELPKIFGRFYRGMTSGEADGVGLGLYLAREIIGSQRGYIKVSSKIGKGSCFSLFLPRQES